MADTVFVTGGTGFVAGWTIAELLKRGYEVRTTVRDIAKAEQVQNAVKRAGVRTDHLSFAVADLTKDEGWDEAAAGCTYVLHVASPLGNEAPRDLDALVAPARDGTLRVLKAAVKAGAKRVVMTSSGAAATPLARKRLKVADETIWTDPNDPAINAYRKSKVLAERAAWEFMNEYGGKTEFTTILPADIFGPVLTKSGLGSVQLIQGLLKGTPSAIPHIGFNMIDVRDVAAIHVMAMTAPEAAGERFIAAGQFMWMNDVAAILRDKLGDRAAKVPTKSMPSFVVRFLALFSPRLRSIVPNLDRSLSFSSEKAHRLLGFTPRLAVETVVDCAESLLR